MNPGFPPSQYDPTVSYPQDASPTQQQHRGSIEHGLSPGDSISSFEESMMHADLMSRTVSDDGTFGSWEVISPSPPADSSPELARPLPLSHSNNEYTFVDCAFTDEECNVWSQSSLQSSQEPEPQMTVWNEQQMEQASVAPLEYRFSTSVPQSSVTLQHEFASNELPWTPWNQYRMPPMPTQDVIGANMVFARSMPFTSTSHATMFQQHPSLSPTHHHINLGPLQIVDNPHNYLTSYMGQLHRSRASANSQNAGSIPPPLNLSCQNGQGSHHIPHPSTERVGLSQSMIAQAGSEEEMVSSPSTSSEYVIVESASSKRATGTSRKRGRATSTVMPPNKQNHGSFMTMSLATNQRSGTQGQAGVSKGTSRVGRGGRKKGSNLAPKTAHGAREMRERVACWQCALQRDTCPPAEICDRCVKRHERGIVDTNHSIGCVREKLYDYMELFIPDHMSTVYDLSQVISFAQEHIGLFISAPIHIEIQPITGLPNLPCELYEFQPRSGVQLTQHQYWPNPRTKQLELVETLSAPISFKGIDDTANYQQTYEDYVTDIASNPSHMRYFARNVFFSGQDDAFLAKLLTALVELQPQDKSKIEFINVNRLLVASYIFSRTCLIPNKEHYKLEQLRFFQENRNFSFKTLPRMVARQFKHVFLRILTKALDTVLRRLDRVFRSSRGSMEWVMAFYGVLGLGMTFEYMQCMVRGVLHSEVQSRTIHPYAAQSKLALIINKIDEKFLLISKLFRVKYNKSFNPILNLQCRDRLDAAGARLVTRVHDLLNEHWEFAFQRQYEQPSFNRSDMYIGRLVSQFLSIVAPP